jgi:hypothetical protein
MAWINILLDEKYEEVTNKIRASLELYIFIKNLMYAEQQVAPFMLISLHELL